MKTAWTLSAISLAFFAASAAQAAGGSARVSTMSVSGKRVISTVEFLEPGTLRATPIGAAKGYLLVRNGKPMAVIGGAEQPLSDMGSADAAGVVRPNTGDEQISKLISLQNTGRKETRAGFLGEVYAITYLDRSGKKHVEELVVSSDPRARELTSLWRSVNQAFYGGAIQPEENDLQRQLESNGQGLLRFSYYYQVDSLSDAQPDLSRFSLAPPPAPVAPKPVLLSAQPYEPSSVISERAAPVAEGPAPLPVVPVQPLAEQPRGLFGRLFGGGRAAPAAAPVAVAVASASSSERRSGGLFSRLFGGGTAEPISAPLAPAPAPRSLIQTQALDQPQFAPDTAGGGSFGAPQGNNLSAAEGMALQQRMMAAGQSDDPNAALNTALQLNQQYGGAGTKDARVAGAVAALSNGNTGALLSAAQDSALQCAQKKAALQACEKLSFFAAQGCRMASNARFKMDCSAFGVK